MTPKAHLVFPTTLWSVDLSELSPHFADWRSRIAALRANQDESRGRSTRLGWSGPKTLFGEPDFAPLQALSRQAFSACLQAMAVPEGFRFGMEAWANVHDKGGFNQPHIHREAILSGSFYLTVPQGSGAIVFHDPRPSTLYSRAWGKGVNRWEKLTIKPRAGMLLIFPNWLEHSVEPHEADEPRCSIAMNAVLPRPSAPVQGQG